MQDDKGEAVAKAIGGVFVHANVADTDDVIAAVEAAKELGPLRAVVNCAGIGWAPRTIGGAATAPPTTSTRSRGSSRST